MWNETKQKQFNELRQREQEGTLGEQEKDILQTLFFELEQEEYSTLKPTFKRLSQEHSQLQKKTTHLRSQNFVLAALAERYEKLLEQAKIQLIKLQDTQKQLQEEYERVLEVPAI